MSEKNVIVRIRRQDTPKTDPYWQTFSVPYQPQMNVISCLQAIAANPVTVDGTKTTPVVWDCNCLEEVCGACTMLINGQVRQSCSALVDQLLEENPAEIRLEPMSKFPMIRDLFVDRTSMFEALKKVAAWVPVDGYHQVPDLPKIPPAEQELAYPLSRCMTCGCCMEACPQFSASSDFIGPAPISQAILFNIHPTGKTLADQRMAVLMGPGGISDCGNAQNCVQVCPKDIPLTWSIARAGWQATAHAFKSWFTK